MRSQFFLFMLTCYFCFFNVAYGGFYETPAATQPISIDLQNTNLTDAVRLIAKFLDINIILSPAITGTVTLHLHNATPAQAFDLLLTSHNLAKWPMGNVLFIAPREELIKRKMEEMKWQEVWNDASPLTIQTWQIKYAKAADIGHLIQDDHASFLSKRGHVRVDERTNTLCVQDSAERIEAIQQLIKLLDVPIQQIAIEARLASVDNDKEQDLGIQFALQSPSQESFTPGHYSLAVARLADGSLLDVKLAALEKAGHAELISSPSLFTANQQPASIEAGEEVPYQEVSESGGTAVTFKKAVLSLTVTPQVLPKHQVLLQLQIHQDQPSDRIVQGVPAISTRQITTNVLVKSGETVVLGGIYETSQSNSENHLPFVHRLPLVGWLFKQQTEEESKRELLIFVTPTIHS